MPALKSNEFNPAALAQKPQLVAFWGDDTGLIRRLLRQTAQALVPDVNDPFQVDRLTFSAIRQQPSLLADTAQTLSLMGTPRLVLVDDGLPSKDDLEGLALGISYLPPLAELSSGILLALPEVEKTDASLKAVEKYGAVTVHCRAEQVRLVEKDIIAAFSQQGVELGPGVLDLLKEALARDSALAENEINKLCLYAHGKGVVQVEDALAVLAAAPSVNAFKLADSLGLLDLTAVDESLQKLLEEGEEIPLLLGAIYKHLQKLDEVVGRAKAERLTLPQAAARLKPVPHEFVQKKLAQQAAQYAKRAGGKPLADRFFQLHRQLRVEGLPEDLAVSRALFGIVLGA